MPLFNSVTGRVAGRKGGRVTKKRHGLKFYSQNGKKGMKVRNKSRSQEGR